MTSVVRPTARAAGSAARWPTALVGAGAAAWTLRQATSPLVRRYAAGGGAERRAGALGVRLVEPRRRRADGHAVLLLHGLVGSQRYFGAAFDRVADDGSRLVLPDLLGFGRSRSPRLEESLKTFSVSAHLDALDAAASELCLGDVPLTVAGHSLGTTLALAWAARRGAQVRTVVLLSAPLYVGPEEALPRLRQLGVLPALMAGGGPVARGACWWMCRQRRTAAVVAAALSPGLPLPVSLDGVQHTWPAYRAAVGDLVSGEHWPGALETVTAAGVPVRIVDGSRDPVPVPGRAARLAADHPHVSSRVVPGAGHHLPLERPDLCAAVLVEA